MSGKKEKLKRREAREKKLKESLNTGAAAVERKSAISLLKIIMDSQNIKMTPEK
jgi:hypothetical protein